LTACSQDSITARVAAYERERDRLQHALADAVGRVIARIEMYDDAVADNAPDRSQALQELLTRCRELAKAQTAFRAYFQQNGSEKS